jgi:hypothetical protein
MAAQLAIVDPLVSDPRVTASSSYAAGTRFNFENVPMCAPHP